MKRFTLFILLICVLAAGCTKQRKEAFSRQQAIAANDEDTFYGLVCDGSNDTILIYLPELYEGTDPDTLDILDASKERHVFGTLRVGDRVAIIRDSADAKKASTIIVTQDLLGQWCYKVKPTLKRRAGEDNAVREGSMGVESDSIRKLLKEEREYGFVLKIDSMALPIGVRPSAIAENEDSPVEYPVAKRYRQWHIHDGKLLLTEVMTDTTGNMIPLATDTAELVMLSADSLVLRFPDKEQSYYRKTESPL